MEKDKVTPEEKLLKIIENPETQKPAAAAAPAPAPAGAKKAGGAFAFGGIKINKDLLKAVNLRAVNKAVIGLSIALTVFWIFDFIRTGQRLRLEMARVIASPEVFGEGAKKAPQAGFSIAEVVEQSRKRNIFSFLPPKAEAAAGQQQEISDLKIVGIIWSDNPQAMIESARDQKTYLLSAGEQLNEFTIKKIFRNKVVVAKEDREWELR